MPRFNLPVLFALLLAFLTSLPVRGQVRTYQVRRAALAPVADGVITPGEWDAAGPAEANWGELLQLSPPDSDTAGNRFRLLWDNTALYLLYETNQSLWSNPPAEQNPEFDLLDEQLYLYFDPNRDDEPNFTTNPDEFVDGYELAFNQRNGQSISTNANRQGIGVSTEARIDSLFGDLADWNQGGDPLTGAAMGGIVIAQRNGPSGGLAELRIPWTAFDANEPANSNADGLYHPFAPAVGDTWFFNIGQITNADSANFMPVYNWTEAFFFAARPHAELTFVDAFPGDFDLDADVDGHDFLLWQRSPADWSLSEWEQNFGTVSSMPNVASIGVPEPFSSLLLATAAFCMLLGRSRYQLTK